MGCGASTPAADKAPTALHQGEGAGARRGGRNRKASTASSAAGLETGHGLETGTSLALEGEGGLGSPAPKGGGRRSLMIETAKPPGGGGGEPRRHSEAAPRSPASAAAASGLATPDPGSPTAQDLDVATPRVVEDRKAREWEAYLERQQRQQDELVELERRTRRRALPALPPNVRCIRPFLSSTFRDFNAERNVMTRETFPRLERLCNERGVAFTPLDLRWGVTSEQSGSGQVIKICLEEIDRCRPFFVGSLGFRNGWALSDEYKDELLEKTFEIGINAFPWLANFRDRSVTEAEMLHGALNDPEATPRCFFYFRDVSTLRDLPEADRKVFCDTDDRSQRLLHDLKRRIVEAGFGVKFFGGPEEMADQLEEDFIECVNRDFPPDQMDTPLQREQKDHAAFADMRTQVYVGRAEQMAALDREVLGGARGGSGAVYISGASGSGKSSLVANWLASVRERRAAGSLGAAGWSQALVVERYIGATPASSSPVLLCRWIMEEVAAAYPDLGLELPERPQKIVEDFPTWLEAAASRAPVLLVLDGLNSLAEESDRYLRWLPASFASGVRVVCSAASGTVSAAELASRGWAEVDLPQLSDAECVELTHRFLGRYGKQTDEAQERMILACGQTRNPLFLSAFLHEVRVFGVYEKVNTRIEYYMGAGSVAELFDKVVERLEEDFDAAAPGLVRLTLSFVLASRQGINERELRGALCKCLGYEDGEAAPGDDAGEAARGAAAAAAGEAGGEAGAGEAGAGAAEPPRPSTPRRSTLATPGARLGRPLSAARRRKVSDTSALSAAGGAAGPRPFPVIEFSSLMLRLHESLVDQRGLRAFSHEYMRQAVRKRYLATDADRKQAMRSLADYWRGMPQSDRRVDEYPGLLHALLEAGRDTAADELRRCLTDLQMFKRLNAVHKYDLHRYWSTLEARGMRDVGLQYSDSLQEHAKTGAPPLEFAGACEEVATFLVDTDRYRGAGVYLDQALQVRRLNQGESHPDVEFPLSKKAELSFKQGRYDDALPLYRQALAVVEGCGRASSLRATVLRTSIADVLKEQGRFAECLEEYRECLARQIELAGRGSPVVAASMVNLAELHLRMDRPGEALPLYKDAREILERAHGPTHPLVAVVLSSQASALAKASKFREALELYERALRIKEEQFGERHVGAAVVLGNMAGTYEALGDHARAIQFYSRSLELSESAYGARSVLLVPLLGHLGAACLASRAPDMALPFLERGLAVLRAQAGDADQDMLCALLTSQAEASAQLEEWEAVVETSEELLRHLGGGEADGARLRVTLTNLGMALQNLERCDEAARHFARVVELAKADDDAAAEATALLNLGVLQLGEGATDEAKECLARCARLREALFGAGSEEAAEALEWLEEANMDVEDLESARSL